jgi:uncharacterized protein with NRDE domain
MCVLALAWKAHPKWRLVVAGNRDELHARPAAGLRRWEQPDGLLAGQDLRSGGTWLGVSPRGRFAVVTNLRGYGPPKPDAPSRGLLLRDLAAGTGQFADLAHVDLAAFSPLSLLTVADDQLVFCTNQPRREDQDLPPGVYGLSNASLDEPWPKTVRLKAVMAEWLAAEGGAVGRLLDGLAEDLVLVPDEPGSAIFVRNSAYGTRCSSVVAIDQQGQGVFVERRFGRDGLTTGETRLSFAWPLAPNCATV